MGIKIVIVPGARHSIDVALDTVEKQRAAKLGEKPIDMGALRITTQEDMPAVIRSSTNVVNKLLSLFTESGTRAVIGNWIRARTVGVLNGIDYQRTGSVERVDTSLLNALLDTGAIPIISNIGWNATGKAYNISSLELLVTVARDLQAAKAFLIGTSAGIASVPNTNLQLGMREDGFYSSIDYREAENLLARYRERLTPNTISLVRAAIDACSGGVDRVHVVDGRRDGILIDEIFSAEGVGTMFYADQYIDIMKARADDVAAIMRLLQPDVEAGKLLPRQSEDINNRLDDYYIYQVDNTIQGCAALRLLEDASAEIESLVVSESYRGSGAGARLVNYLLQQAQDRGVKQAIVLTTQSSDFFMELGFKETSPNSLPTRRRRDYDVDRNPRVLIKQL